MIVVYVMRYIFKYRRTPYFAKQRATPPHEKYRLKQAETDPFSLHSLRKAVSAGININIEVVLQIAGQLIKESSAHLTSRFLTPLT